jgi:hypothetical protein
MLLLLLLLLLPLLAVALMQHQLHSYLAPT